MHTVVLDTNIFISSIFWRDGNPHKIVASALEKKFQVFTSFDILEELERVLIRDFEEDSNRIIKQITLIVTYAYIVIPAIHIPIIDEDPDDNKILECAVACDADFIVTGDNHLLKLKQYQRTQIVNPTDFLRIIG